MLSCTALLIMYLKCLENVFLDYYGMYSPMVHVIDVKKMFRIDDLYLS